MFPKPANFDPIARPYRWLEYLSFGRWLERCRYRFLDQLGDCRHALVLGDGDGRFTARLLAAHAGITVDAVDSSSEMLRLLTERAARLGPDAIRRLKTAKADALTFAPDHSSYDLVVTHFFLDCFTNDEAERLVARLKPHLSPDSIWLLSEFAIPKRQPLAALARVLVTGLYGGFRLITGLNVRQLPDYPAVLQNGGFVLGRRKLFLRGLLTAELWHSNPARSKQPSR